MGGPAEVAPSPPLVHGSTLPKQLFAGLGQTQPDADGFGAFGPGACTGALDRLRTQHFSTARVVVLLLRRRHHYGWHRSQCSAASLQAAGSSRLSASDRGGPNCVAIRAAIAATCA